MNVCFFFFLSRPALAVEERGPDAHVELGSDGAGNGRLLQKDERRNQKP